MAPRRRTKTPTAAAPLAKTSPPSQSLAFPVETLDNVFSHLWNDFAALRQLSLTCRSWSSIIRPYIFRRVWINGQGRLLELGKIFEDTPAAASWIREVHIQSVYHMSDFLDMWTSHDLFTIMEKMQNVRSLVFSHNLPNCYSEAPDWSVLTHNISKMIAVQELVFFEFFAIQPVALSFIKFLPNLQSLTFYRSMFSLQPGGPSDSLFNSPVHITSLSFHLIPAAYVNQFLLGGTDLKSVQTMDIVNPGIGNTGRLMLPFVLRHTWPSLHTLQFVVSPHRYQDLPHCE